MNPHFDNQNVQAKWFWSLVFVYINYNR